MPAIRRPLSISTATCLALAAFARFSSKGLLDVRAVVVPGVGAAAAQVGVDRTRRNQKLILQQLPEELDPADINKMHLSVTGEDISSPLGMLIPSRLLRRCTRAK